MYRPLTHVACLALMASLTSVAVADPIMGTINLTVAQVPGGWGGYGAIVNGPLVYSTGPVDLSQLPQDQTLTGPLLMQWYGLGSTSLNTTFDLEITFDGASGSQPTIDVTGNLTVNGYSTADLNDPNWIMASIVDISAKATFTSATVQGWTPESGIPLSLINNYLDLSNYGLSGGAAYSLDQATDYSYPTTSTFGLGVQPTAATAAPEPATVLMYLAAIAGLGMRRGTRLWRSCSGHQQ